eukprot:TRINITY_DN93141_c0_g1_i1.p1 TRINITY_DN93141_c0_g1~~TRINITY_DN93141_c0_g1_i1.p1  ORF type:complete len:250 (+),score=48.19 TRINITY_DN93141_c0_g1_i1:107-856(+)
MIYIFNCMHEICTIPGKICNACGELCNQMDCTAARNMCKDWSKGCSNYMDRPLSSYVVVKAALGMFMIGACLSALQDPALDKCVMPAGTAQSVGLPMWLQVQIGFGVMHLLFAPYLQTRVWQQLSSEIGSIPVGTPGPVQVPASTVHSAFKHVYLHDFGVLFYILVMICAFVWSYMGSTWINGGYLCDPSGYAGWGYYSGLCFFWISLMYTSCYYFCSCCASSVELKDVPYEAGEPGRGMPPALQRMNP